MFNKTKPNDTTNIENAMEPKIINESIDRDGNVILVSIDDNGSQAIIELSKRKYILTHPGNRKAMKIRQLAINLQDGGINNDKLLDEFFRVCVEPYDDQTKKPDLDDETTVAFHEVEVWLRIANRFLAGKLEY